MGKKDKKYIEIIYAFDELKPGCPWVMTMGNLPKIDKGRKYRIYVEEIRIKDDKQG